MNDQMKTRFIAILVGIYTTCIPLPAQIYSNAVSPLFLESLKEEAIEPVSREELTKYEQHPDLFQTKNLMPLAIGYLWETNYPQAISIYQKILAIEPDNRRAIRGLGQTYLMSLKCSPNAH